MFNPLQNTMQPLFGTPSPYGRNGVPQTPNGNSANALVIPEIVQAFQNDPRAQLAIRMMQQGGSTSPVAGGGWAWADGIARALQGVAGGYIQRQRQRSFQQDQQGIMSEVARALSTVDAANAPQAAPQQPAAPLPQMPPQAPPAQAPQMPAQGGLSPDGSPSPEMLAAVLLNAAPVNQSIPGAPYNPVPGVGRQSPAPQPPRQTATPTSFGVGADNAAAGWYAGDRPGASRADGTRRHLGTDMFSRTGAPLTINRPFTVSRPRSGGISGNRVDLTFDDGTVWWPMHLPELPRPGRYEAGTPLLRAGLTGTSGRGTPHIHMQPGNDAARRVDAASYFGLQGANAQQASVSGTSEQPPAPQQSAEFTPYTVQQVTTPEPQMPEMPQAPVLPAAVRSQRGQFGRELLQGQNPYLFSRASQAVDAGMTEDFNAQREAIQRQFEQGQTQYGAGLNDFYGARGDQRQSAYRMREGEQREGYEQERLNRQMGFNREERIGGQQFQRSQQDDQQGWQSSENILDRSATAQNVERTVQGRIESAAARRGNYFQTPQGTRMLETSQAMQRENDAIIQAIEQFAQLNSQTGTGGVINNVPGASSFNRWMSPNLQQMEQITSAIAPRLRQAGSGAMSDRDLENFRRSLPNINNSAQANTEGGQRIIRGMRRINDYEIARLNAQADGRPVEFMREWRAYMNAVSIDRQTTFDEWRASVPQYNAQGQRQQQ